MRREDQEAIEHAYSEFLSLRPKLAYCRDQIQHVEFLKLGYETITDQLSFKPLFFEMIANDCLRTISNSVNDLVGRERTLRAWAKVLSSKDEIERNLIFRNLVEDQITTSVLLPYTVKERMTFYIAQVCHQANLLSSVYSTDNKQTLPEEHRIQFKHAEKTARHWTHGKACIESVKNIASDDYIKSTKDFRRKFVHRFAPTIQRYEAREVFRSFTEDGRAQYTVNVSEKVSLEEILPAIFKQCEICCDAYATIHNLIKEQEESARSTIASTQVS